MKPQQARFEKDGTIVWEEVKHKPTDTSHLQKAMFTDRPDLWRRKTERKKGDTT